MREDGHFCTCLTYMPHDPQENEEKEKQRFQRSFTCMYRQWVVQ